MTWNDEDRAALVALMRLTPKRAEWSQLTESAVDMGSARELWDRDYPADLLGPNEQQPIFDQALADVQAWKSGPVSLHTFRDESFPAKLLSVRKMPPVVFTRGHLVDDDEGVCVVGSREASESGMKFAAGVSLGLAEQGLTVIAGLALGIDTIAHRTALDAGGRTVAVLGNGVDKLYPAPNRQLQDEIAERGMLLSHFLPEMSPTRYSFPARNATMSGYSVATVIAEASERSGTRIQAREAIAHGRALVMSSSVAMGTSWGRELTGTPSVYVASDAQQALEQVGEIMAMRKRISQWVANAP